ncbi:hypothetical protein [Mesorhizobium neociceri]|uniref:hypothetical protein n=1 Tax=Mesorhizobium neociceri TaxID=1307853 RepID=UPI0015E42460|nr:hypothetical protein [Mesorhizobium neociceri]
MTTTRGASGGANPLRGSSAAACRRLPAGKFARQARAGFTADRKPITNWLSLRRAVRLAFGCTVSRNRSVKIR